MTDLITIAKAIELLERKPYSHDSKKVIALLKSMEWQPIETAPKGTVLYVCFKNRLGNWRTSTAFFASKFTLPLAEEYGGECGDWHEPSGQYYCTEGWYEDTIEHENSLRLSNTPIFWQSRPTPPEQE